MANNWFFRLFGNKLVPDIQFDAGNIPTSSEKDALAGEGTPSSTNKFTTRSWVDALVQGLVWKDKVDYSIEYVSTSNPTDVGAALAGEQCLDTTNKRLYTCVGGPNGWFNGSYISLTAGMRFIWMFTGNDGTGSSGNWVHTNHIYEYNGSTFVDTTPTDGFATSVNELDAVYVFNGTSWIKMSAMYAHNELGGLQGGQASEYYHLTSAQADALANANSPSASNYARTKADRGRTPVGYILPGWGFVASQTNQPLPDVTGVASGYIAPKAGSLIGLVATKNSVDAAGTLAVKPTINGTAVTPTDLNCALSANSGESSDYKTIAPATSGYTFSAGAKLGALFTSNADWTNGGDLTANLLVVFD